MYYYGGGNKGSTPILNTFSIKDGIILLNKGHVIYNEGLEFASIKIGLNYFVIIKSKPNN